MVLATGDRNKCHPYFVLVCLLRSRTIIGSDLARIILLIHWCMAPLYEPHYVHWSNSDTWSSYMGWQADIRRLAGAHDVCWCDGEYWHSSLSRSVTCHNLTRARHLMQRRRRTVQTARPPPPALRGGGQDRGLIKDGTVYGEREVPGVRDCMESGVRTVERRSGETRVYGTRCEDVGMLR